MDSIYVVPSTKYSQHQTVERSACKSSCDVRTYPKLLKRHRTMVLYDGYDKQAKEGVLGSLRIEHTIDLSNILVYESLCIFSLKDFVVRYRVIFQVNILNLIINRSPTSFNLAKLKLPSTTDCCTCMITELPSIIFLALQHTSCLLRLHSVC